MRRSPTRPFDEAYQNAVKPGGPGPADHPTANHKIVYDYVTPSDVFEGAGFEVDLLEYCDADGRFHYHQSGLEHGMTYRCLLDDHRNKQGTVEFVSLLLGAIKPFGRAAKMTAVRRARSGSTLPSDRRPDAL